jgi:hypothetical protein
MPSIPRAIPASSLGFSDPKFFMGCFVRIWRRTFQTGALTSLLKQGGILIVFESLGSAYIDFLITFLALSEAKGACAADYASLN